MQWITRINNMLNIEQIIKGCIKKDAHCQKVMFEQYANKFMRISLRYARNKSDAEEILQDTFIKVFDKISQFRNDGCIEAWIRRILINTALCKYRSCVKKIVNDICENEDIVYDNDSIYSELSEKELLNLINKLPDGYRTVFNMYAIEGYKHEEIAELLQINSGTSRSQLAKAKNMLKKQIL